MYVILFFYFYSFLNWILYTTEQSEMVYNNLSIAYFLF